MKLWIPDDFLDYLRIIDSMDYVQERVSTMASESKAQAVKRLEELQNLTAAALEEMARVREVLDAPDIAEPKDGSVVKFSKQFNYSGRWYTYAAIRIGNSWYITQSSSYSVKSPMTWKELYEFATSYNKDAPEFKLAQRMKNLEA